MKKKKILALGFFDGIHVGHQALLRRAVRRAEELHGESAVVTFDVHPDALVFGSAQPLINSAADRVKLMERSAGIREVIFHPFTRETMEMPWRDYLDELRENLDAAGFVVGHDFRFGYRGEGCGERLREYARDYGLSVDIIPPVRVDGVIASSTGIRSLLEEGKITEANRFLGHAHLLSGEAHDSFLPWGQGLLALPAGRYPCAVRSAGGEALTMTAEASPAGIRLSRSGLQGPAELQFIGSAEPGGQKDEASET